MAKGDRNSNRIVDRKWVQIFQDYNVLDRIERDGAFTITSKEINRYKEARLMTKFDYVTQLPDIFYYNNLSILPTKRGEYIIGPFSAYKPLTTRDNTLLDNRKEIQFPGWIDTIDPKNITSESTMLNAAAASGMIQDVFGLDYGDLVHTVSGRMSSDSFSFNIGGKYKGSPRNYMIDVINSQVEIDGGFETPDKLILFEAKNNTTDSFLVRQLYYPYQLWARQLNKEVVPVFLQYANETFNFSIFRFNDVNDYNSLELVDRKNYIFGAEHTSMDDIVDVMKRTKLVREPEGIPFPQANSFNKVLGVLESIKESENGFVTNEDLTLENDYVLRQADYYTRACMYLDLIERIDGGYVLSQNGKEYLNKNRKDRNLFITELLLRHKPIRLVFEKGLKRLKTLNGTEAFKVLEELNETGINLTTRKRRGSTIASWVKYIFSLVDDY